MPVFLITTGLYFLIVGARGTQDQVVRLLDGDFTGKNNFVAWLLAIFIVGAVGYVDDLQPLSDAFLTLLLIVLLLSNGGFFSKFFPAVGVTPAPAGGIVP